MSRPSEALPPIADATGASEGGRPRAGVTFASRTIARRVATGHSRDPLTGTSVAREVFTDPASDDLVTPGAHVDLVDEDVLGPSERLGQVEEF